MKRRNTLYLFVFALALVSACAPAPTATPLPTATQPPTATATATFTPQPTFTETALPTSTATPTATATRTPTATPEPSPTSIGNYREAQPIGEVSTYGGIIDFSTLPPTESNALQTIVANKLGFQPGGSLYSLPGGQDDYFRVTRYERRKNGEGHPYQIIGHQYIFKALKAGSEIQLVKVVLSNGSSKTVSVIKVEAATLDSNGNPVKVVLQIDTSLNLYLNIANRTGAFYIDPSLPHLASGVIRAGDVFGLTANGPVADIDKANGREIELYAPGNIALYVNVPWQGK